MLEEKLQTIHTKKQGTFQERLDTLHQRLRTKTGYKGSFDDLQARGKFFSEYAAEPLTDSNDAIVGVQISYKLRTTEAVKPVKTRSAASCHPFTVYD